MQTYILPTGKDTYSFVGADNRVDAWEKMKNNKPGSTYKDVVPAKEYFKRRYTLSKKELTYEEYAQLSDFVRIVRSSKRRGISLEKLNGENHFFLTFFDSNTGCGEWYATDNLGKMSMQQAIDIYKKAR